MEDVLDVYTRPYDPRRPLVCLDETSRQLLAEVTPPLPVAPGRPARDDYEYVRNGVGNVFLVCEPLRGWRQVTVSERRTRIDWAHCIKELVDVHYPDAERIVLVQDNLNTHTPASLYEAFQPAEAKRLADKLEIHYTPKHGSWLNMAEIELSVLAGQCLDRRLADRATLEREVAAWQAARNGAGRGSTGASRPRTRASSSSTSTLQFRADQLLAVVGCWWGARAGLAGLVAGLEDQQQLAELLALAVVEAREEFVLGGALGSGGGGQVGGAGRAEGHDMAAAVGGVALAGHVPVGLQRVEQRHQNARVDAHDLAQLLLAHGPVVVEQAEQVELAGAELVGGVGVTQPAHGHLTQQRQQQPGAGSVLLQDAAGRLVAGRHPDNVAALRIIHSGSIVEGSIVSVRYIASAKGPPDARLHPGQLRHPARAP